MLKDLILRSYTNEAETISVISENLSGLSLRQIKLMLKEVPVRILAKESEDDVDYIAFELQRVGCTVTIL